MTKKRCNINMKSRRTTEAVEILDMDSISLNPSDYLHEYQRQKPLYRVPGMAWIPFKRQVLSAISFINAGDGFLRRLVSIALARTRYIVETTDVKVVEDQYNRWHRFVVLTPCSSSRYRCRWIIMRSTELPTIYSARGGPGTHHPTRRLRKESLKMSGSLSRYQWNHGHSWPRGNRITIQGEHCK